MHNSNDSQGIRLLGLPPPECEWIHGCGGFSPLWAGYPPTDFEYTKGALSWVNLTQLCEHCKSTWKNLRRLISCCPLKCCLLAFVQHVKGNGFCGLSMGENNSYGNIVQPTPWVQPYHTMNKGLSWLCSDPCEETEIITMHFVCLMTQW